MTRLAWMATLGNLVLVAMAFAFPFLFVRREDGMAGAATAALLFATPMVAALGVGIYAAVRSVIDARSQRKEPSWGGFVPLTIFGAGLPLLAMWAATLS